MFKIILSTTFALLATPVLASEPIRLCTGSASAVYYDAGKQIQAMAGSTVAVRVIETEGTIDNINKTLDMDECDAMIGQPDGPTHVARQSPAKMRSLRQVATLHREYMHVLCNRSAEVRDLRTLKGRLAIGEPNSGAWLLWQNLVTADKTLEEIPVSNESGIMALSSVSTGVDAVCMLVPAGLRNGTMLEADATFADTVELVGASPKNLSSILGVDGKPIYTSSPIDRKFYPNLLSAGWFGSSIDTVSWTAGVFINTERFTNPKQMQAFVTAVNRAAIGIKAEYGK